MIAHESQRELERRLGEAGVTLDRLSVEQGFALMFEFYRNQRADDCNPKESGDMLLFQLGTNDGENGKFFELDLTRQFTMGVADDENIWQLSLTYKFLSSATLDQLGSGNKWCPVPRPQAVDYFERFVRESGAFQSVAGLTPAIVELDYFNAG